MVEPNRKERRARKSVRRQSDKQDEKAVARGRVDILERKVTALEEGFNTFAKAFNNNANDIRNAFGMTDAHLAVHLAVINDLAKGTAIIKSVNGVEIIDYNHYVSKYNYAQELAKEAAAKAEEALERVEQPAGEEGARLFGGDYDDQETTDSSDESGSTESDGGRDDRDSEPGSGESEPTEVTLPEESSVDAADSAG